MVSCKLQRNLRVYLGEITIWLLASFVSFVLAR
jgi:hypothetical protein